MKNGEREPKSGHGTWNSEKRKHARYDIDLPIEYTRRDLVLRQDRAINASESGLLVHFSEQMEAGQYLRIKLFFPSYPVFHSVEMVTQVVWIEGRPRRDERECRTGVRYVGVSAEDLVGLKNFLASLSR